MEQLNVIERLIARANKAMGKEDKAAKLSTKQRKNLKDSQFCGPGRSFPVNDCAHYTAALRLLNKSKYSDSTKAKIRACINRRGKKLGCGGAKKAKAYMEANNIDVLDIVALDIFEATREMVEYSIKNPGVDIDKRCCN